MAYLNHRRRRPAKPFLPFSVTDFGGRKTLYGPIIPRSRNALFSENVSYHGRKIQKALGYVPFLENAVGATQIDAFESGWTGGAAQTGADDFVLIEAGADGTQSLSLSQTGVGTATMTKAVSLNLGSEGRDVFHIWRKPLSLPSTVTGYQLRLRLQTSSGNHFEVVIAGTGALEEALEVDGQGNGRALYHRTRRDDFTITGSPDWTNITLLQLDLEVTATTAGALTVAFDNLYWSGGFIQDLFQYRRLTGVQAKAKEEFAINAGVLYKSDGKRWIQVLTGFDVGASINSITSQDRRFITDGVTSPQKIMPDGTTYRMGIVTPPKQLVLTTNNTGGAFADQDVYVVITYYSTITGIESAPDQKTPGTKVTLSAGTSTQTVVVSNIPTSPDPQVTHVRVYIRPANLSDDQFFRASGDPDGEITNGTSSFTIAETVTNLDGFEVLDPDKDYPSYVDKEDREDDINGTVVSATSGTVVLDFNAPDTDDSLNGRIVRIISGTGSGQIRVIDTYAGATRTVAMTPDWAVTPDITSIYKVLPSKIGVVKEAHPLFFAEHAGYLLTVMAEAPTILRYSQLRNSELWPLDNEIPLGENDSDPISGLANTRTVGLAFKRDAIFPIRSVGGPAALVAQPSISERGSVNHKGIVRIGEQIWFPNEDGAFWLDRALNLYGASAEDQVTWDSHWDTRRLTRAVGVELRRKFQYHLYGPSLGAPENNKDWVTNTRRQEGVPYDREPDYDPSTHTYGADAATSIEDTADIHRALIATNGMVFQLDVGTSRDGRGFEMRHKTSIWSPYKAGSWVCRWPWTSIIASVAGDTDLVVDVYIGGVVLKDATPLASLKGQSSPLGTFVLGTDVLGAGPYTYEQLSNPPKIGRFIQYEFRHAGRGQIQISGVTSFYRPVTQRGNF